jgi:hypothetical protein
LQFQAILGKEVCETSSKQNGICLSSQLQWEASNRRTVFQAGCDKKQDPIISKIGRGKRARGAAPVVEYLSSQHKALSSSPRHIKALTSGSVCLVSATPGSLEPKSF